MAYRFTPVMLLSALVCSPTLCEAGSWPTFRGPGRTAIAPDTGLLQSWPEAGPKLLWSAKGAGRGYSSLAIVDGRIYTMGDAPSTAEDDSEYLLCFDLQSGEQIWKTKTGPAWNNGQPDWQSSRCTPTIDGNRIYAITPHGKLISLDTDGNELWRKDLKKDFGGKKADGWGYSESVLIDGDKLVCTPGGVKNTLVALNKQDGELIWSAVRPEDRGAGHASIVIAEVGGRRVYVQTTGSGALGVDAETGAVLWSYTIEKTTAVIPTPIVRDDLVFFTAGYKRGGALLRQVPKGDGIDAEEIYPLNTKLSNKHGGIVLIGDHLYGDSDAQGIPFCADLMTGKEVWKSRGSGRGSASMVAADGYLYIRFSNGIVALAKATPKGYKETGSFKIPGSGDRPSWSHPVIVDGKLYLREGDLIHCYSLQK